MGKVRKDHYEVLGVGKDASADELKRAYREKARRVHPDKGGDALKMAEINQAYECLSDSGRRLLYDQTGQDERKPFDEEVRSMLLDAFSVAMQSENDLLGRAGKRLAEIKGQIDEQKRKVAEAKKALTVKRNKISAKGMNLFHLIVDRELQTVENALCVLKHQLEVWKAASRIFAEYKTDEVVMPKRMVSSFGVGGSTSSWTG